MTRQRRGLPQQKIVRLLTHHRNSIHHGIEATAIPTLHAPKVPCPIRLRSLAVIAYDRHHLAQLRRDGLGGDSHRDGIPRRFHALLRLGRLLADGTPTIVIRQLLETMPVYGMAARQLMTGRPAREQILLADGTIAHVLARLAVMLVEEPPIDAHSAVEAVSKVFASAHAAESAVGTVVRTLLVGHPQVAYGAVVLAELDVAADAKVAGTGATIFWWDGRE